MGERVGLAGACSGNDQERRWLAEVATAMFHGTALLWVELFQVRDIHL